MIGREIIFKGPLIILSFGLERNSRIFIMRMFLANTIFRDPPKLIGFPLLEPCSVTLACGGSSIEKESD